MTDYEFLKSILQYDQDTGLFTRIKSVTGNKGKAGNIAGSLNGDGYISINFRGTKKGAHRLAWLYMMGEWPSNDVDHVNGCRTDNRWGNLREADDSMNAQNQRKASSHNKSGYLGASKCGNKYRAQIRTEGRVLYIGLFDTALDAHNAYVETKRKLHLGNTL